MADLTRAKESDLADPDERKAEQLSLRVSALTIPVISLITWAFLIFLGIALWLAFG